MDRDKSLETLRGLAAVSVVFWHTILGLFPDWSGIFPALPAENALNGSLLYCLINGTASVGFFFVLSGFVLSRQYFIAGDANFLLRNAVKRWPRLALPVVVVVLLSWAFFYFGLYRYEEVANFTQSPWLSRFAYAYEAPFKIDFLDAVRQGLFLTFFRGDSYYDSSLWTMWYEFVGSFIAFGMAFLLGPSSSYLIRFYLVAISVVIIYFCATAWFMAFPIGVLVAATLPRQPKGLPLWASAAGIAGALYLAGYSRVDRGVFHPLFVALNAPEPIYIWIAAAVILLVSVLLNSHVRQLLSTRLGVFFGWISFPLYLVHIPILCSLGCATFLWAVPRLPAPYPNVVAALATVIGSVLAAIPLAMLNGWLLRLLNQWTQSYIGNRLQSNAGSKRA